MRVVIGVLVRGRVKIKIRIWVRVRVRVGIGLCLTLVFILGAIIAGANLVHSINRPMFVKQVKYRK